MIRLNDQEILEFLSRDRRLKVVDTKKKIIGCDQGEFNGTSVMVYFTFYKSINPKGFRVVLDATLSENDLIAIKKALQDAYINAQLEIEITIQPAWYGLTRKKVINIQNTNQSFTNLELFIHNMHSYGMTFFWANFTQSLDALKVRKDPINDRTIEKKKTASEPIPRMVSFFIDLINEYF